jgi:hypothetical protein
LGQHHIAPNYRLRKVSESCERWSPRVPPSGWASQRLYKNSVGLFCWLRTNWRPDYHRCFEPE